MGVYFERRRMMVDNIKYWKYLKKLEEEKFTGKVTINFFKGGVTNMNKVFEPIIEVEESVKLR